MKTLSLSLLFLLFAGFSMPLCAEQVTQPLQTPGQPTAAIPTSSAAEKEKIFDIKAPIDIPDNRITLLLGTAVAGTVVLLVLLGLLWKNRSGRQRAILAHERALQQLDQARHLIDDHDVEGFVTLIDQTLRTYIEQRFAISARRQTTREFITGLTGEQRTAPGLLTDNSENLQTWLSHCDMVKFARGTLDREHMENMLANLHDFIQSTRLKTKEK